MGVNLFCSGAGFVSKRKSLLIVALSVGLVLAFFQNCEEMAPDPAKIRARDGYGSTTPLALIPPPIENAYTLAAWMCRGEVNVSVSSEILLNGTVDGSSWWWGVRFSPTCIRWRHFEPSYDQYGRIKFVPQGETCSSSCPCDSFPAPNAPASQFYTVTDGGSLVQTITLMRELTSDDLNDPMYAQAECLAGDLETLVFTK